jgi:hypothetical protein
MISKVSKGYKALAMEGFIAEWYDKNTEKDIEEYRKGARGAAQDVAEGSSVSSLPKAQVIW